MVEGNLRTLFSRGFITIAGVVKLVDAADSKSAGAWLRAGSIPALGTRKPSILPGRLLRLV